MLEVAGGILLAVILVALWRWLALAALIGGLLVWFALSPLGRAKGPDWLPAAVGAGAFVGAVLLAKRAEARRKREATRPPVSTADRWRPFDDD